MKLDRHTYYIFLLDTRGTWNHGWYSNNRCSTPTELNLVTEMRAYLKGITSVACHRLSISLLSNVTCWGEVGDYRICTVDYGRVCLSVYQLLYMTCELSSPKHLIVVCCADERGFRVLVFTKWILVLPIVHMTRT